MLIRSAPKCFANKWKGFVDENGKAMFQTALLLSLSPLQAEAALITSVAEFDLSRPVRNDDFLIWERAVVKLSVGTSVGLLTNERASLVWPLLQPGLRPLTQISHLPRMSFVLRLLLGYTPETCAQILGIERSEIAFLIADAAAQFGDPLPTHFPKGDAAESGRPVQVSQSQQSSSHGNGRGSHSAAGLQFIHKI
jgi:hypothetical protein